MINQGLQAFLETNQYKIMSMISNYPLLEQEVANLRREIIELKKQIPQVLQQSEKE